MVSRTGEGLSEHQILWRGNFLGGTGLGHRELRGIKGGQLRRGSAVRSLPWTSSRESLEGKSSRHGETVQSLATGQPMEGLHGCNLDGRKQL